MLRAKCTDIRYLQRISNIPAPRAPSPGFAVGTKNVIGTLRSNTRSKPSSGRKVARLAVTEGVRLIHPADCIGTQRILCGGSYHEEDRQSSNITDFFICVFHRRHSISASSKESFRHRWLLHPTSSGAPSRREPWNALHFSSLPPTRTRQKRIPFSLRARQAGASRKPQGFRFMFAKQTLHAPTARFIFSSSGGKEQARRCCRCKSKAKT